MKNIFIAVLFTAFSFKTYAVNNIKLEGNSITTHNENGDINITPRGTGALRLNGPVGFFGAKPDASAAFEIKSTTLGAITAPLMSEADRDAISNPARGLQIYNTDTDKINIFDGGAWTEIGGAGGANTALSNLVDPTAVNEDLNLDATKTVRLKNDVYLMGRDTLDTEDVPLIKSNGAESVTIGDESAAFLGFNKLSGFTQLWTNANADGHFRVRADQLSVETFGTSGAHLELLGGTAGGSYINLWDTDAINSIGFKSPDVLSGSALFTLPDGDGLSGQILSTDGAAQLSWVNQASTGFVSFELSPLFNGSPSTWGADIPATVIDGSSADANSAGAAGIPFYDPTGVNWFIIGTQDLDLATTSSPLLLATGANATGPSADLYFRTGPAGDGAPGGFKFEVAGISGGVTSTNPGNFTVSNVNKVMFFTRLTETISGIKPASKTSDPCSDTTNYPEGTLFYNDANDYFCFCNASSTAKQMHSPLLDCTF